MRQLGYTLMGTLSKVGCGHLGLHTGPPALEASALPLSYIHPNALEPVEVVAIIMA